MNAEINEVNSIPSDLQSFPKYNRRVYPKPNPGFPDRLPTVDIDHVGGKNLYIWLQLEGSIQVLISVISGGSTVIEKEVMLNSSQPGVHITLPYENMGNLTIKFWYNSDPENQPFSIEPIIYYYDQTYLANMKKK